MADQLAFNINFFLYTRFVFGFYHEFQAFKSMRWLARCYCCLISAGLIFFLYFLRFSDVYPISLTFLLTAEYLLCVLFSLLNSNRYFLQYYKKTPLIDASPNTYRPMRICLVVYICLMFIIKFFSLIIRLITNFEEFEYQYFSIFEFIMWFAVIIGRASSLFVFTLLYTRVRLMRQTLENNNFDCRNQGKHHPRRYIQMYEAIMDGLEECNNSMKLQLFVNVLCSPATYILGTFKALYFLRNSLTFTIDKIQWIYFVLELMLSCSPLFLIAVLADLVSMEIQEMLGIIIERSIVCKSDRDYEEIQKLFQLLKGKPFEYSLWRVVPLNVRSLLAFFSSSVTTSIAILQIQGWTA